MKNKPKIGIVGIGMVGAPLARYFSEIMNYQKGKDLFLFDIDTKKKYTDDINKADIIFIAVPTPKSPDGSADIGAVQSAFQGIKGSRVVVIKSTVPPGTTEYFQKKYSKHKVLFNPEFLTERHAWDDFIKPDRQIVGFTAKSIDASYTVLSLLPKAPFMSPWGINTYKSTKITATEAEIIKYAGNVYFSRKVNFANIVANLAEKLGTDYESVRQGIAADFRIGDSHLDVKHGGYRGFGGYCLPKDLDAFIATLQKNELNEEFNFLLADRGFNEKLLASQGLNLRDVSVHDQEWIKKKLRVSKNKND
ncbi:MAG: hypothetical protein AAB723_01005 [Patescibacteria group bacterium]